MSSSTLLISEQTRSVNEPCFFYVKAITDSCQRLVDWQVQDGQSTSWPFPGQGQRLSELLPAAVLAQVCAAVAEKRPYACMLAPHETGLGGSHWKFIPFEDGCLVSVEREVAIKEAFEGVDYKHLLDVFVENSPISWVLFEPVWSQAAVVDFRYLKTNAANARMTGRSVEEMMGSTLLTVFPMVKATALFDRMVQVAHLPGRQEFELFVQHDGIELWGEFVLSNVAGNILFTALDITAQKKAQQVLKAQNAELERLVAERTAEINRLSVRQNTILENAGSAILATDERGVIQQVNSALEDLTGFNRRELVGRQSLCFIRDMEFFSRLMEQLPDHRQHADLPPLEQLLHHIRTYGTLQRESKIRTTGGQVVDVLSTFSALYNENQEFIGLVNSISDISYLKKIQREEQEANRRLTLATQLARLGIWEFNFESERVQWDEGTHLIHGTDKDSFTGKTGDFLPLIYPEDRPAFEAWLQRGFPEEGIFGFEMRMVRPDGKLIYTETSMMLIRDEKEQPVRLLGVVQEHTARRTAELSLKESEQRFREMAENVDEMFWVHDMTKDKVLYVNPAFERTFGQRFEDLKKDTCQILQILQHITAPELPDIVAFFENVDTTKDVLRIEVLSQDGRKLHYQVRKFIIEDELNHTIRRIVVGSDITAEVEREHLLEKALQGEKELNHLKSQFVGLVSHQLKNPLATILSGSELIKMLAERVAEESLQTRITRFADQVMTQVQRITALINEVLTQERLQSGDVVVQLRAFELIALCRSVVERFGQQEGNVGRLWFRASCESLWVYLDPVLLEQSLENVISNGLKYSAGTSAPVEVEVTVTDRTFSIGVKDYGIGIPEDEIQQIGRHVYRASNAKGLEGTGLGLSLVRQFVTMQGGDLTLVSQQGEFTLCTITLPLPAPAEQEAG